MAQPSNTVTKFIRRLTAAGAASTGKVLADFAFYAYYKTSAGSPTTFSHASTITELASGYYAWSFTVPSAASHYGIDITVASGTDYLQHVAIGGELENQDLDAIYAANSRPIVSLTSNGTIGQTTALTLVANRYREVVFSFVDSNGDAIDMTDGTTYTNYTFGVRKVATQALQTSYDAADTTATTGFAWVITGASGTVTVKIPEDAAFFVEHPEGASATDNTILRYELTADLVSPADETIALVQSSTLTLTRREVGTT